MCVIASVPGKQQPNDDALYFSLCAKAQSATSADGVSITQIIKWPTAPDNIYKSTHSRTNVNSKPFPFGCAQIVLRIRHRAVDRMAKQGSARWRNTCAIKALYAIRHAVDAMIMMLLWRMTMLCVFFSNRLKRQLMGRRSL